MKVAIIVCFSKYYHRAQVTNVNSYKSLLTALIIIILPTLLVLSQPDLGTSILIALSGLIVIWLAGINIRYFIYTLLGLLITSTQRIFVWIKKS